MGGLLKRDGQIALQKIAALEARVAYTEARLDEFAQATASDLETLRDAVNTLVDSLHAHTNAVNAEFLKWHVQRIKERG